MENTHTRDTHSHTLTLPIDKLPKPCIFNIFLQLKSKRDMLNLAKTCSNSPLVSGFASLRLDSASAPRFLAHL